MTYISLKGARESKTANSEEYKKNVIEFMQSKSYVKTHDSARDAILPDLIFKMPLVEGDKETWVEIKYSELSLKDKQFLNELGRIFNGYMLRNESKRFSYFIFAKKFLNQIKWRNIFEETKGYEKDVKEFQKLISNSLDGEDLKKFREYGYDDFVFFITECSIFDADYTDLLREININKEKKDYVLDQELLRDESRILHKKEMLMSNCIKVTSLPKIIWVADCNGKIDMKDFFRNNRGAIVYLHSDKIYSVKPLSTQQKIKDYIKPETIEKINLGEWIIDKETKKKIIKYLIRSFIILKGTKIKQRYYDEHKCLFFINPNPGKYPEFTHRGYVVSSYYNESDFVKHDAIHFDIKEINEEFYVIFNMRFIFTKDGYEVITGDSAAALHTKFRKNFTKNDGERNKLSRWIKFLNFNIRDFFETESDHFIFSPPVNIESSVTYEGGESFDVTLLDFIEKSEEDHSESEFEEIPKKQEE